MQLSALAASLRAFFSELLRRKVLRVASLYVVTGWIVLQVSLALQTAMSLPGGFSTVILSLLIIGLPAALVVSWFFEFTRDGVKRTAAAGEGSLVKPQTTDWILIGLLLVVAGAILFQATLPRTGATPPTVTAERPKPLPEIETPALGDKSIAVLPFANLSSDEENKYFADGLAEELLDLLAKISDLKVISRTSSFAFERQNKSMAEFARELGVRHVVEGSVRREGDNLRVTAQLIDVTTDTHLWSETYERKLENVFALQDELARNITSALNVELTLSGGARAAPTKSMEAYRLFLKARALHFRRAKGDLLESVDLYKRAIELDAEFAEAHAWLATSYFALAQRSGAAYGDLAPLARQAAKTALELTPNLGRAYGVLGQLARSELSWAEAVDDLSRANTLDRSDPVALAALGGVHLLLGEFEQGDRLLAEAGRIDPVYNLVLAQGRVFSAYIRRDDRTAALRAERLTLSTNDNADRIIGFGVLSALAHAKGDYVEAEIDLRATLSLAQRSDSLTDSIVAGLRSPTAFELTRKALFAEAARDPTFEPEAFLLMIGDNVGFFDALDARLARGDKIRTVTWLLFSWRLISESEEANQRFKAIARKVGFVDYWKEHGWPDKCRPTGEDDFECN